MDSNLVRLILVLGVTALVIFVLVTWTDLRVSNLLQAWAHQKGYILVSKQRRRFARTPFGISADRFREVFRVTVQDRHGKKRQGWVRFGVWWFEMRPDKVEARWDDET